MSVHEAFLRSIIEAPDDDTPRLIYADWLDDNDDPDRAEFIRVQCSLAGLAAGDPRQPGLADREQELLRQHGWAWAEDFSSLISAWTYRRGFIEVVQMHLETTRDAIRSVLGKAPIRHIRDRSQFCDFQAVVDALPDLHRLTGLEFWGLYAFEETLLEGILSSPHLANLRTLVLHHDRNGNIADEDLLVRALHSPYRSNLRELAVNVDSMWRGPSRNILKAIAESPYLRHLRKLNLTNAGDQGNHPEMDLETTRTLGQSPNLAGLEELDLGRASFPIEAWDEVLRWPWLSRLKWLRLHDARHVNPPSILTVAELRNLPAYRQAFEHRVAVVDWDTEFPTRWFEAASSQGLSWAGLRRQHLFSMWSNIRRRDYDGLESAFRADCCRYAGATAAEAIDALPFARYQTELATGLNQAIEATSRFPDATAIYLRIRTDIQWRGEYHVSNARSQEPFEPHEEYSYTGPLAQFGAPSFPEAAEVRTRFSVTKPLDPGGASHYLLARTVAAFGRCVARRRTPVPVFFSCIHAVFRM
jgi:uncharacterized protein (TIGR02996 family)